MKKIALFILFIFTLVQLLPGTQSIFSDNKAVFFTVDEEKNAEKITTDDLKEKKEYPACSSYSPVLTNKINIAFHLSEKILPAPAPDQLTPPPNFC